MGVDLETMAVLSTAHITLEDSKKLADCDELGLLLGRVIEHRYGWIINLSWAHEDEKGLAGYEIAIREAGWSKSMAKALLRYKKKGCSWVNFDESGDLDKKLKIHEW